MCKRLFTVSALLVCLLTPPLQAQISPGMALVPEGEYQMGDQWGWGNSDERPTHDVNIDAFYIDIYEVTNRHYRDFLNQAQLQGHVEVVGDVVYKAGDSEWYCNLYTDYTASQIHWDGTFFSITSGREDHPMVDVSWYGATAYANWRSAEIGLTQCYDLQDWSCDFEAEGFRLPTEAEWEKAARGGEHNPYFKYPWGDTILGSHANYDTSGDPYYPGTTPVGYYDGGQTPPGVDMANGYGLYDMAGNVFEWCYDRYSSTYFSSSPYDNPQGPEIGSYRVFRGGSFDLSIFFCRVSYRYRDVQGVRQPDVGFRLAKTIRRGTISAGFDCTPSSGVLPFPLQFTVMLNNEYGDQARRVAGQINAHLANGLFYPGWRAGYTNIDSSTSFVSTFTIDLPNLASVIGDNVFTLAAEDVTPAPYNQPPYMPAGDTDSGSCLVTGLAP